MLILRVATILTTGRMTEVALASERAQGANDNLIIIGHRL